MSGYGPVVAPILRSYRASTFRISHIEPIADSWTAVPGVGGPGIDAADGGVPRVVYLGGSARTRT